MGFTGPGLYEIVPYQAPNLSANSWGGGMEAGAVVRTYPRERSNPANNAVWQLAHVDGSGDHAEYLIINSLTGYFLTATDDNKITSTPQMSPADHTTRWTIKSIPTNGYDVFTINNKVKSRGQLNVSGGSTQTGADILSWPVSDTDNAKWYFDRRT